MTKEPQNKHVNCLEDKKQVFETTSEYRDSHRLSDLFELHNQALVQYLQKILGSREDASEVAQEAYVRFLRLDQTDPVSHLRAFLFKTARNIAIDKIRRRAHQTEYIKGTNTRPEEVSTADNPEVIAIAGELATRIEEIIKELPFKCQKAFILYKFRGKSYSEIAAEMNLTESMIRKYVLRAVVHCDQRLWEEV